VSIIKNERIKQYIDTVLQQIDYEEAREEIRVVLESYFNELVEFNNTKTDSEEGVIRKAIKDMGDPMKLGKELAWLEALFTFDF